MNPTRSRNTFTLIPFGFCGINPQPKEVYPQGPRRVRCRQTDPIRKGKGGWGGRAVRDCGSACPASNQGKRALSVGKRCQCTIANTLAADQCAQRSDELTLPKRSVPGRRNTLR